MPDLHLLRTSTLDEVAEDLLDQGSALESLLTILSGIDTPACIAVYGAWGSGKTTLMRRARSQFDERNLGKSAWFDPWLYEQQGDVLTPLLLSIRTMTAKGQGRERALALLTGIAKTTLALATRTAMAATFAAGPAAAAGFTALASIKPEDFEHNFEETAKKVDNVAQIKDKFRQYVDIALEEMDEDSRLVIFLDDLDRCLPENVLALLEGVKLLMCGAEKCRAVFVFALDREIVGEAIRSKYPGTTAYTGEHYLEKIFDFAFEIPTVQLANAKEYIQALLNRDPAFREKAKGVLRASEASGVELIVDVLANQVFANPRTIKRTLNRLMILLADDTRARDLAALITRNVTNGDQGNISSGLDQMIKGTVSKLPSNAPSQPPDRERYLASHLVARRAIAWIAGAERFRYVRQFVLHASHSDIRNFAAAIMPTAAVGSLPPSISPNLFSYSVRQFMAALGAAQLGAGDATWLLQRRPSNPGELATVEDIDALMRRAGI